MIECSYCGARHEAGGVENWSSGAETVRIFTSRTVIACIESKRGERWICEECYVKRAFRGLDPAEKAEVHYQMGLEYRDRSNPRAALTCLRKSLGYRKHADTLAALASCYARIGRADSARRYYLDALKLDPCHFMATENLAKLSAGGPAEAKRRIGDD